MSRIFYIDPQDISIRTTEGPTGFHKRLVELIRSAQHKLSFATLYWGTGDKEAALLDEIAAALEAKPALRVTLLVDFSRGQRKTANGDVISFTRALTQRYPERFKVYLHKMPQLNGMRGLFPSPLDETLAVFHFKAIVSDQRAILTGANLSDEYYHCRQCRAIEVQDAHLSDLLHALVATTAEHSHQAFKGRLLPTQLPATQVASALLNKVAHADRRAEPTGTTLEPIFQHPSLGIHQEQQLLEGFLARPDGHLEIHTPYVNFPPFYVEALKKRLKTHVSAKTRLVCPSGDSHSFTTGRGPKALVPSAYMYMERKIVDQLRQAGPLELRHYHRPGWVFHSKGMWRWDDHETSTIIGSSSFGGRSVWRDFDLSFLLTTNDERLRQQIAQETSLIERFAPAERHVQRVYQRVMPLLTPSIRSFL